MRCLSCFFVEFLRQNKVKSVSCLGPTPRFSYQYHEKELQARAKSCGGRWDPRQKIWRMRFKDALDMGLEERILPEKNGL